MTLQDYTRRAAEDRGETFRDGPSAVTVLAYFSVMRRVMMRSLSISRARSSKPGAIADG